MQKFIAFIFMLFLLTSCFNKEETKIEVWTSTWNISQIDNSKVMYSWVEVDISEENISKQREEILLDDIDLALNTNNPTKNSLLEAGKKFRENLDSTKKYEITKNINWWIEFEELEKEIKKVPEKLVRNFEIELKITDYKTWEEIKNWTIFVNWVKFWEFENWTFTKKFDWFKWIEKFDLIIKSENYWDSFVNLNSLNWEWSYLYANILMKKSDFSENYNLEKELKIENQNLSIKIPECTLIDNSWRCHKWEVKANINYITADDVNSRNLSVNMKAITKEGKISELQSGWMMFTDFVTENWDILSVKNWGNIEITYKVDEETILNMENTFYWQWEKNWYWLFDKNKNIWIEKEAKIILDKENKTWTAIVSEIY